MKCDSDNNITTELCGIGNQYGLQSKPMAIYNSISVNLSSLFVFIAKTIVSEKLEFSSYVN